MAEKQDKSALIGMVENNFEEWRDARAEREKAWEVAYYNLNGVYAPGVQGQVRAGEASADPGKEYFVGATAEKVRGAMGQISDTVQNPEFSIQPATKTGLPMGRFARFGLNLLKRLPMGDMAAKAIEKDAAERLAKITAEAQDELEELYDILSFGDIWTHFAYEAAWCGTGIIRTPTTVSIPYPTGGDDPIKEAPGKTVIPCWQFYPDPAAKNCQDGAGWVILHLLSAAELRRNGRGLGWDQDATTKVLSDGAKTDEEPWESTIRSAEKKDVTTEDGKYRVKEMWGLARVGDLKEHGVKIPDAKVLGFDATDDDWIECVVVVCQGELLKAAVNPFYPTPYRPAVRFQWFEKPGQFWGDGIGDVSKDCQRALNSSHRSFLEAIGFAGTPMNEIDPSNAAPGQDLSVVYPGKVWVRKASASGPIVVPVSTPVQTVAVLQNAIQLYEDQMTRRTGVTYESTGMPAPDSSKTATEATIREGNMNALNKARISRLDTALREVVAWDYKWMTVVGNVPPIPVNIIVAGTRKSREAAVSRSQRAIQFLQIVPQLAQMPPYLSLGEGYVFDMGEFIYGIVARDFELEDAIKETPSGQDASGAGGIAGINGGGQGPMGGPAFLAQNGGAGGDGISPPGGGPQGRPIPGQGAVGP